MKKAVKKNPYVFKYLKPDFRLDLNIQELTASKRLELTFCFPPDIGWNENQVSLSKIVTLDGKKLVEVRTNLINDEIVDKALTNYGLALEHATSKIRANQDIVKKAVNNDGMALKYASLALRDNKEIVKVAVSRKGLAIQFASTGLRNDKDIALCAVEQDGLALEFVNEDLKDRHLCITALHKLSRVDKNQFVRSHVPLKVRENVDFAIDAIKIDRGLHRCFPQSVLDDKKFKAELDILNKVSKNNSSSNSVLIILGIIFGFVLILAAIAVVIFFYCRNRRSSSKF